MWCLHLSLVYSGLPAYRARSVLIEVTRGTRAAGLKPNKTVFMARLQWFLILENAVKFLLVASFPYERGFI